MFRSCLALALVFSGFALAQAPDYAAEDIVNASDYSPGPFAPNSVLTIFGSNLSWYTEAFADQSHSAAVPTRLSGVQVFVDQWPAPLLYVSPSQINFLIPANEIPGAVTVRVVREGVYGPLVNINLVEGSPALFLTTSGFAIATHADGTLLTGASPGRPGEIVVVYATGLGPTYPNTRDGEIPTSAAPIRALADLTVALDGAALPPGLVEYAGATPNYAGLYQLNIYLPIDVAPDPVLQVSIGAQTSSGTPRIAVQ